MVLLKNLNKIIPNKIQRVKEIKEIKEKEKKHILCLIMKNFHPLNN